MDETEKFKQTFFTECSELLADMEERLTALVLDADNTEQLNGIFRAAHSIKGGSGAFGFNVIMKFTHSLEAMLDELREKRLTLTQPAINLMLKAGDVITTMLESVKSGSALKPGTGDDILQQMQGFMNGAVMAAMSGARTNNYQIEFTPHRHFFDNGSDPLSTLRLLDKMGVAEICLNKSGMPDLAEMDPLLCFASWSVALETPESEEAIIDCFEFISDRADISVHKISNDQAETEPVVHIQPGDHKAPAVTSSIRVDLEKIDRLVNTAGELVIAQAMLNSRLRDMPAQLVASMQRELDEITQYTRELQEAVMSVRMQPVKSVFARMPRLVRDTAAQLNKEVQLIMQGENTEIDKTVIEQLSDPLMHMIRNSIDHGIETPDQRAWDDKPQEGTIVLSASQHSGRILIEIRDDGAGINRSRVLDKAKEKGLLPADASPSNQEIDNLIFMPGFSTAETVTSVSGRGVGMDVVKRNIENMGGTVSVSSTEGQGSCFSISLPLTLAILDGMIVRVGDEHYIIPTTSIVETLRPAANALQTVKGHSDVINVRGEIIPVIYLAHIFGITGASSDIRETLMVIVEGNGQKMAIMIDELIGQQQVVIKSFESNAAPVKGISSATILGDGKVSLILEINDLRGLCQATGYVAAA